MLATMMTMTTQGNEDLPPPLQATARRVDGGVLLVHREQPGWQ
jgi:hypothetical protein